MTQSLFCFGFGYCAEALAEPLRALGWTVAGTARRPERIARLQARGFRVVAFDAAHPLSADALEGVTHILVSIAPEGVTDPVLSASVPRLLAAAKELRWVGYLSTTGVYGDTHGALVDETSILHPTSDAARARVLAERGWLDLVPRLPVHIFRLAGIYGPGRSALDEVRAGRARRIVKPGHLFNRVHVADIAAVLKASMERPNPGAIYNVCDDEPAAQADVIAFAASLAGVPVPPAIPFEQASLSPMAAGFWADNRRVSNRRIKEELGVVLAYPGYRDGLRALAGGA